MSQEIPPPEKGAGNPAEKVGDGTTEKAPKGFYTQAQVDDIVKEKTKREVDRVKSEKDAEIEKFRQAAMTEEDKKLEAARKEGEKASESKLAVQTRKNDLTIALLDGGANPKRVRHLIALASEFAAPNADLKETVELLKKESPEHFQGGSTNFGPGDGVTKPNAEEGEIDFSNPDAVQEKLASFKSQAAKSAYLLKHKDEIELHQFGGKSIVRTLPKMV